MASGIDSPVLNSPYDVPQRHFVLGPGGPTGEIRVGRRQSESYIPVPPVKKGRRLSSGAVQEQADFDLTGERREQNSLINDLRRQVERWRRYDFEHATPTSKTLLRYWGDPERGEERVFFCQREAAETAIFLAEVAGRHGYADWRQRLAEANSEHNAGLPRVALKMATGAGKTVVMAMLIAWQTLNKVASPRDARFARRFLVVTPGITIRDRLRVLQPGAPGNYYDERQLVPPELRSLLGQARVSITNYHAFLPRDAKEISGVSTNTRKILRAGRAIDAFEETPAAMVSRVLRDLGGAASAADQLVVFNDEAHHCYQVRSSDSEDVVRRVDGASARATPTKEDSAADEEARVWFRGLQAVHRDGTRSGVKAIYDLSATPYYLSGSGWSEGFIFPWTVSDFSLIDAIESGIVKVPRTPVDDDATGELVTYLRLWDHVGDRLPKRVTATVRDAADWPIPKELEGALRSLYRSYEKAFEHWERKLKQYGETPPVFIVVCPNTTVSKLVFDWIAGSEVTCDDGTTAWRPGNLDLLSNVVDGQPLARPRTILVDSAQLESGEKIKADFKSAAAAEIEAFKADYRRREPGADVDKLTDEDLLREVMNTVGKRGRLGEAVRCVVSVAMLTEGWDANTVTHILGIRPFRSQLLCEQVVGRGLRRRSYVLNDDGLLDPEYANVYGIPFLFLPTDRRPGEPLPSRPLVEVCAVEGRQHLRIEFPRVDGYRFEVPDEELHFSAEDHPPFVIGPSTVPRWVELDPVVGEREEVLAEYDAARPQQVAFRLAKRLVDTQFRVGDERRPWLFPRLVRICRQWLAECVEVEPPYTIGRLMLAEAQAEAAEAICRGVVSYGDRRARLRPLLRRLDPAGTTGDVHFATRKRAIEANKSEVSHVTLDGAGDGNTWEQILALECELHPDVASYVKNDHLGFTIPYLHKGRSHLYVPDFLVRLRLRRRDGDDVERTLVVEVSGSRKSPGPTKVKALTARDTWCPAVNNAGSFGRWGFVEITEMTGVRERLTAAIEALYDDGPVIGDPDRLDLVGGAIMAP